MRDPFGIAARDDPEGSQPAADRNGSKRVGAKREISRNAVTDAAGIVEEPYSTIARILVSRKKIPRLFLKPNNHASAAATIHCDAKQIVSP